MPKSDSEAILLPESKKKLDSKEILLKLLTETRSQRKNALPSFQISCLDKLTAMISAIPVDEKTEMHLRTCGYLLDQCLCDLDKRFGREHTILGLINMDHLTNDEFYEKANRVLDDEVKSLNKYSSDSFYDQSFKIVKVFLIEIKREMEKLKTELDQRLIEAATLAIAYRSPPHL
ncbi:hypothetical protein [Legionella fallonii]|uniref:Uncharacterized protein n=1 Tax=Legionella fallonii LLAP-10 TaxID=1212491 RepID=A0A098G846_9GAMM|nr:hypothetical protein [Legionella fallonii]CEG58652.1 protein of unknown function [Legionella fallonii LLAP-10]